MASRIPPLLPASPPPMNKIDAIDECDSDGISEEDYINFSVDTNADISVDTSIATSNNVLKNEDHAVIIKHSTFDNDRTILENTCCSADSLSIVSVKLSDSCCRNVTQTSNENSVFVTRKSSNGDEMTVRHDDDWRMSNIDECANCNYTYALQFDNFGLRNDCRVDVISSNFLKTNYYPRACSFSPTSFYPSLADESQDVVHVEESRKSLPLQDKDQENFFTRNQMSTLFDQKTDIDNNLSINMLDKTKKVLDYAQFYDRHNDDVRAIIENQDRHVPEANLVISSTTYDRNVDLFSNVANEKNVVITFEKDYYDYGNNDDDDFSDFVSPVTIANKENNFCATKRHNNDSRDDFPTDVTRPNPSSQNVLSFVLPNKFLPPVNILKEDSWNDIFGHSCEALLDNTVQVNVNTIEGKLKFSSVWCTIKDIHASPALKYNWSDSEASKILLSTLYIDRENIFFVPKWNSEVPRFASNLGFVPLIPQKTSVISAAAEENQIMSELPSSQLKDKEKELYDAQTSVPKNIAASPSTFTVPDAHFDWNDSGLTNPLDARKFESSNDHFSGGHWMSEKSYEMSNSTELPVLAATMSKRISNDVAQILNNLPDLIVMEKQYVVFPIR